MQRDKKGRFVKKAEGGTQLTNNVIKLKNGKTYRLKEGEQMDLYRNPELAQAMQDPDAYEQYFNTYFDLINTSSPGNTGEAVSVSLNTDNNTRKTYIPGFNYNLVNSKIELDYDSNAPVDAQGQFRLLQQNKLDGLTPSKKIKITQKDGKYYDERGVEVPLSLVMTNPNSYEIGFLEEFKDYDPSKAPVKEDSKGMNIKIDDPLKQYQNQRQKPLDKTKMANFLEFARAGIGAAVNNKVAERALEAEKPFLQDVSESHRAIYGDYRSQIEGEKAAAKLRNTASKPLTSDGALQQQMMMEAQIKGQEYIDRGNANNDAIVKQTREVAWQQEKENTQQRQSAAMQNRQAMLMSQKNKAQIENVRDSANFSQVAAPLMAGIEQRLRNEGKIQKAYQDYYDDAIVAQEVWNTFDTGLSDSQKALRTEYLTGGTEKVQSYVGTDKKKYSDWLQLQQIMNQEIIKRKAAIKGAFINPTILGFQTPPQTNQYGLFVESQSQFKKGGTIYKAKLSKRTKDNDRGAKSIESSKKIAARFLEKAIDSLYSYNDVELIAKPKNKKRKYQAGGSLPFVNFAPVFATDETGAPSTKTKETDSKEDLSTKDILELLKDMDGLPSDMQLIVSTLKNFSIQDKMDPLGLSSSSDIASKYISLINKIKVAKFHRDEYNSAFNQLKGNGGLNEFAITSDGMLIGTNAEGDFKQFSISDIKDEEHTKSGYQLLTNSNLLYLRANSTDAAFNHKLTSVAQNGIGMETVNSMIKEAIANIGTTSMSEEGYVKTKSGELLSGLSDFQKAAQAFDGNFDGTVNDLYKYKYLTKSQAEQAKKAMAYIYNTLPTNAKTLLKVKSDGTDNGAVKLIEMFISAKETNEKTFELDLVGGKTHSKTTAKDTSNLKTSLPLNVQKSIGGIDSFIDIDRGDGIHMSVRGTQYNHITTPNGQPINDTSMATMLSESGLQSIVKDLRNIQFGDQRISPEALSSITYNNTGITRTNLPIKADGSVNLELLEAYEQAERELDAKTDPTPEDRREVYEKYKITELINADGTYNQQKFAPFIVTEGYTTDALSGLKSSEFVKEFKGDEDAAIALIQKSLAVGEGKNKEVPNVDEFAWYNPGDWFSWTDKIFKGVIYIPITNNVNSAVFGSNQSLDYDEALTQEEKYQNFDKMTSQRTTSSDLLNL